MQEPSALLLYDGRCGVCAGSVQFLLRREPPARRAALRFAPLGGPTAEAVLAAAPALRGVDSVLWRMPDGRVLMKSEAALAAAAHLGGGWALLAALGRLVPRRLRDAVYDAVARRRLMLAPPACLLPTPEERARFLP